MGSPGYLLKPNTTHAAVVQSHTSKSSFSEGKPSPRCPGLCVKCQAIERSVRFAPKSMDELLVLEWEWTIPDRSLNALNMYGMSPEEHNNNEFAQSMVN